MRLLAGMLAALAAVVVLASASPAAGPGSHDDPAEGRTRLDLVGARFAQTASGELALVLRTHKPLQAGDLDPAQGRLLCVWLRGDRDPAPRGRICAVSAARAKSGLALRYTALDRAGQRIGIRNLTVDVQRGPAMISARFAPALLRLEPGLYHWQARSLYEVEDRLPDNAEVAVQVAGSRPPASPERCFGAASRDPGRRCVNRRLRLSVVPTPADAVIAQNSPCTPLGVDGVLTPCEFGLSAASARATVALVGDSHAAHWRAALEVAAQRRRWRGISITRSGCPLSRATAALEPASRRAECLRFNEQVPLWFAGHRRVHTAFIVQHVAGNVAVADGVDEFEAKIAGFTAAWQALPASVTRIVVIRDTPLVGLQALECVRRAQARGRDAGRTCAVPRRAVMEDDAAVVAARRLRSRRVQVVDMSRFLCDARRCFPVVGGALVYKDGQHLTEAFATTLGPYLLREVDRAAAAQRRPKLTDSVDPSPSKPPIGDPSARPTPTSR